MKIPNVLVKSTLAAAAFGITFYSPFFATAAPMLGSIREVVDMSEKSLPCRYGKTGVGHIIRISTDVNQITCSQAKIPGKIPATQLSEAEKKIVEKLTKEYEG